GCRGVTQDFAKSFSGQHGHQNITGCPLWSLADISAYRTDVRLKEPRAARYAKCPLLGVKRTSFRQAATSACEDEEGSVLFAKCYSNPCAAPPHKATATAHPFNDEIKLLRNINGR